MQFTCRKGLVVGLLVISSIASADITLTLNKSFVEKYKRRATISGGFIVDKAHKRPNAVGTGSDDGDMHVAGRSPAEIGLPTVAEIMNATRFEPAVDAVHAAEGTGQEVPVTGVWRLWFEHPGSKNQVQGAPLGPDTSTHRTNPDHVFEIHPLTRFGDQDLRPSFTPIIGEDGDEFAYKASDVIKLLEKKPFHVRPNGGTVNLSSGQVGYNYIDLKVAKLEAKVYDLEDGAVVFATLYDLNGVELAHKRRLVLVAGTPPETALRSAAKGTKIEIVAVSRVSLSLVSYRMGHSEAQDWKLPYELVVVAVK